jgi:arylsulfatase A-like enzyme
MGQVCDQVVCHEDIMPTVLEFADVAIPDSVEGKSLVSLMRGQETTVREFLHGEHGNCYGEHQSNHYMTDGKEKYVWYTHSGQEQLFDLTADPAELHDLASCPEQAEKLEGWRNRLVAELAERPEGFSDGTQLIAGRPHAPIMPRH